MSSTPSDLERQAKAATRATAAIDTAGGLVGRGDLEERWGLSRSRVRELTLSDGFPEPVAEVNGQPVWFAGTVDLWRANRPGPGRPRRAPAAK